MPSFRCYLFAIVSITSQALTLSAQDHYWWADNVQWDGITHWSEYIISSPRFMGPNALPIPALSEGMIDSQSSLGISGNWHQTTGDRTLNPAIAATYVLVKDKLSFKVDWVPLEYFRMSHDLKTERNTFHTFYDINRAQGDIYLNTLLQVLRRAQWGAALRIGYKFATSTRQGLARFTDAPAYYFDGSVGFLLMNKEHLQLKASAMAGIYIWQTNSDIHFQNDAILGGAGLELQANNWRLVQQLKGYSGYLDNGDRPLLWQSEVVFTSKKWSATLAFKKGFFDRLYDTMTLGISYSF